ncbi:MAG: hypothetical protein AVDCRST_MAG01-01-1569, partial [uncultured Rubrobacteraceae bacterium]
ARHRPHRGRGRGRSRKAPRGGEPARSPRRRSAGSPGQRKETDMPVRLL